MFAFVRIRLAVLGLAATVRRDVLEARPGAETAFAALRAGGVRVCLVTEQKRTLLDHAMDVLGWRDLVDLTLAPDVDDGMRGPPAPDLLLLAALHFRVDDVREVAVAGDTEEELIAATRAGASIRVAIASGPLVDARLRASPYSHLLRDIDEFPAIVAAADDRHSSGGGM